MRKVFLGIIGAFVSINFFVIQSLSSEVAGRTWLYNAVIQSYPEKQTQTAAVELLFVNLRKTAMGLAVVRTPWQTEVKKLYGPLSICEFFRPQTASIFLVCVACWPRGLFELLPMLEDPFPWFLQFMAFLRGLPLSFRWEALEGTEISFFAKGTTELNTPFRAGITLRFGFLTQAETPLGLRKLLPLQVEVIDVRQQTFFMSWCNADEDFPYSLMEMAPVRGEGVIKEAGVVRVEFSWQLTSFAELEESELIKKIDQALTEMAGTARLRSEEIRKELRELGIGLP